MKKQTLFDLSLLITELEIDKDTMMREVNLAKKFMKIITRDLTKKQKREYGEIIKDVVKRLDGLEKRESRLDTELEIIEAIKELKKEELRL